MPRTLVTVDFSISSTLSEEDLGKDDFTAASIDDDSTASQYTLPLGLIDEELLFTNIASGKFLLIRADQDISVKLNDVGATAIPIIALDTGQPAFLVLSTTGLTKIFLTTTVETVVLIVVAGS